jgi:hypothetical protein
MTHAEMRRMFRLVFGYLCLLMVLAVAGALSGCNADCASPFEKPDVSTDPVTCQGEGCAK